MELQTLPRVREALGDEGTEELLHWLEQRIQERAVPRDEYREVLSRLDLLDKDVSLLRDEVGQTRGELREELGQMQAGFREELGQTRAEFREELGQMQAGFRDELGRTRAEFREELGQLRLEMNKQFNQVNERFDRVHERFDQMYDRMLVQTRWLIGSLALIGTVISALLAIGQFVK